MQWNWQKPGWPELDYQRARLQSLETEFLKQSGVYLGTYKHISSEDQNRILVGLLSDEAVKTSEIEGEFLDRSSVQFSIFKNLGLAKDSRKVHPPEKGIADLVIDLYRNFNEPLSHEILFKWHAMICSGRSGLDIVGGYREHESPMQVVSGRVDKPTIHFEAPPSSRVKKEMEGFINWFNTSVELPGLARAGLAHLYFVTIHPFEDGNGRIARALAEKSLFQALGEPVLISLSTVIEKNKQAYYSALADVNRKLEVTAWLEYFSAEILSAQKYTQRQVDFIILKTKFFDRLRDNINERQEKVLLRVFSEGPDGFEGGLSKHKYVKIAKTSSATATRDLKGLVELGALVTTGQLKSTRYHLNLEL